MFGFSFWLLGCSIPSSKSSFPPPNQAASAARRIFIFSIRTSAFTVAPLVARKVERLVGLFIWFLAVLLWPIVLNVTVWSIFFALSMWKVQCTCGSLLFICPTSAFTFAPLVARNGGTPCWIPFSLAVPGFALRNRFRVVRDLCFTVVEGPLCAQSPIYFLIQRHGSGDPTPCGGYPGPA